MSEKKEGTNQTNPNQYQQAAYPYYYYPQASQAYYPYLTNTRQQFPQQTPQAPSQQQTPVSALDHGMLPAEQSYIENILRLNRGKRATVYMTFENNPQWTAKIFKGIIEAAGRDHIILSDPQTGKRFLLLMVYLDYVTFDEEIVYTYPFAGTGNGQIAAYPPR
ncbi:spore coat protein GerQ [Virgibacillus sp. C22-A2]|uniref:Spore coat protein GerQ n=1 Tax=Virgibacillus tibetensis TaxID=3042313 RepID=A0ABU6KGJ3_9BACI|nr:spore coat protein GerQ [Virgibacillus sp. C22-A2]